VPLGSLGEMVEDGSQEEAGQRPGTVYGKTGGAALHVTGKAERNVERGLNDIRLAVLGILVTVGLAAAAIPDTWSSRLGAGLGSFLFACFLINRPRTRRLLMSAIQRLTGY
jgi:hypothetical protein